MAPPGPPLESPMTVAPLHRYEWENHKIQNVISYDIYFLIYLLLQITDGLLVQYADDTTLICSRATLSLAAATMNAQLQLIYITGLVTVKRD